MRLDASVMRVLYGLNRIIIAHSFICPIGSMDLMHAAALLSPINGIPPRHLRMRESAVCLPRYHYPIIAAKTTSEQGESMATIFSRFNMNFGFYGMINKFVIRKRSMMVQNE